jgi:hypothetical protein
MHLCPAHVNIGPADSQQFAFTDPGTRKHYRRVRGLSISIGRRCQKLPYLDGRWGERLGPHGTRPGRVPRRIGVDQPPLPGQLQGSSENRGTPGDPGRAPTSRSHRRVQGFDVAPRQSGEPDITERAPVAENGRAHALRRGTCSHHRRRRQFDHPAVYRLEVELERRTNRASTGSATWQTLLMIRDLQPGQRDLGIRAGPVDGSGNPPAPAGDRVPPDFDVDPPHAVTHRLDAARAPLSSVLRRMGSASR